MTATVRVALLGHGIGSSLSPALHMEEAHRLGLDYEYRTVDLRDAPRADLGAQLSRLEEQGYVATNVTHPFKRSVLGHVDSLSPAVRRIGAANLVLLGRARGRRSRTAHNTDGTGFRGALERFLAGRPAGGRVVQVGAGGAGLATVSALVDMGFEQVVVHDVAPAAVAAVLDRFGPLAPGRLRGTGGSLEDWLPRADGVVHATPVGMVGHPGVALDVDRLAAGAWVAEVVYRPLETALVRRARARGLATLDGGAMAVGQAADSLRLITGLEPDLGRMRAHFARLVADDGAHDDGAHDDGAHDDSAHEGPTTGRVRPGEE
ncbi:shikimate dehydrogenase [Isoptericola sp. F-RaC21]|uniref:shikimate dehydrogenase n=1 Tax=Isoptericola sp. F-RaC21 TaxID=3141452 RepID=UPI00315C0C43